MKKPENYNDLAAFVLVAQTQSFTQAAAKLGVTQSALSQTIKTLEEKMGLRLLNRTTRSVSPTHIGEQILNMLAPKLEEIELEISRLKEQSFKPSGTLKITSGEHAALYIIQPAINNLLKKYPDINIEISVDHAWSDIIAKRYDAGVRLGDKVELDMISMRISADFRMALVGTPDYFANHSIPQSPMELINHNCISIRMSTHSDIFSWEFAKDGKSIKINPQGQCIFNTHSLRINAVLAHHGLAFMPEDIIQKEISTGKLIRVLEEWCPIMPGYHLYYPHRKYNSPAFSLFLESLRYNS